MASFMALPAAKAASFVPCSRTLLYTGQPKTVAMSCNVVLQYLFSFTSVATLRAWRNIRSTPPNVLSFFCPTNSANANSVNVSHKMLHHTTNSKLVKCFKAVFAATTSFKTLKMARYCFRICVIHRSVEAAHLQSINYLAQTPTLFFNNRSH